jgi:hypothetical protein
MKVRELSHFCVLAYVTALQNESVAGGLFRHLSNRSDAEADDLLHIITRHSGLVCTSQCYHCTVPYVIYSTPWILTGNIYTITWRYQSLNQLQWHCRMPWAVALLTLTNPHQNSRLRKSGQHSFPCRLHIVHLKSNVKNVTVTHDGEHVLQSICISQCCVLSLWI